MDNGTILAEIERGRPAPRISNKEFAQLVADECGYSASTCERVIDCYWKNVLDVLEKSKPVSVYMTSIQLLLVVTPVTSVGTTFVNALRPVVLKLRPKKKYLSYKVSISKYRYFKWVWMMNEGHQFIEHNVNDTE